jgi:transposase
MFLENHLEEVLCRVLQRQLPGPVNREVFELYVEKVLVPELEPGDIVVMDNLASHKEPAVRAMIRAASALLLYLPPYSPDVGTRFKHGG